MSEHRYLGTVSEFKSERGFGYIERDEDVPEGQTKFPKRVFVQWKQIETDDRWPSLEKEMKVEFSVENDERGWKAIKVTQPGGEKISVDRDKDMEIVDGEHLGTVKFFNMRRGFGYIELEKAIDGIELKDNRVHVARSQIFTEDEPPALKVGAKVKFSVFKNDKGYNAKDVSNPDGEKISFPKSERPNEGGGGGGGGGGGYRWKRQRNGGWNDNNDYGNKRQRNWGDGESRGNFVMDPAGNVEVGLFIKKWIVGGIVGKKGETIRQFQKDSGAKMQFGEDNIHVDGEIHRVLALSGTKEQVANACIMVANKIGDTAQALDRKLLFLVPEQYCGMLIGKKGATIKKIQGENTESKVRADVSHEAIQLPGAHRVNIASIFGGVKNVERAIKEIVEHLGHISQRIAAEYEQMQPPPNYGGYQRGGWQRGRRAWRTFSVPR